MKNYFNSLRACHVVLSVLFVFDLLSDVGARPEYREECRVWRNITDLLQREDNIKVICVKNPQCTGFDCNGIYKFSALGKPFNVSLCFGMFLHPCADQRGTVSIYSEMKDPVNAYFGQTYTKNESTQVPGTHYEQSGLAVDGFMDVTIAPQVINTKNYVLIGMRYKMRMKIDLIDYEEFPDNMRFTLVPDMLVPVPDCDASVQTNEHKKGTCNPYELPINIPMPTGLPAWWKRSTPTTAPMPNSDIVPGTKCKVDEFGDCDQNQICDRKKGQCTCITGYGYDNKTSSCVGINVTTTEVPIFAYPEKTAAGSNLVLIVSCSVGAVVVVGIVLAIIIFRYRAHRARYGNHQPLLNNEDDDDPIDIAA